MVPPGPEGKEGRVSVEWVEFEFGKIERILEMDDNDTSIMIYRDKSQGSVHFLVKMASFMLLHFLCFHELEMGDKRSRYYRGS